MTGNGPPDGAKDDLASAAAIVHIQQLAIRYAYAVDSRDIDMVAGIYVPDVECGHWGRGREALRKMYSDNDATMGVTIHRVSNHLVDLTDDDNATGIVYLIAEHQMHDGTWARLAGAYHDTYVRQNGRWYIKTRKLLFWYRDSDAISAELKRDTNYRVFAKWQTLPEAWPTWRQFWDGVGEDRPLHPSVRRSQEQLKADRRS